VQVVATAGAAVEEEVAGAVIAIAVDATVTDFGRSRRAQS
jgi:hypothetical protein